MDHQLIISNIEDVAENGTTRGWIVPAGTEADALDEAINHVDIPADEDPDQWRRNLTAALAVDGWELDGELQHDGPTITAPVKPRPPETKPTTWAIRIEASGPARIWQAAGDGAELVAQVLDHQTVVELHTEDGHVRVRVWAQGDGDTSTKWSIRHPRD